MYRYTYVIPAREESGKDAFDGIRFRLRAGNRSVQIPRDFPRVPGTVRDVSTSRVMVLSRDSSLPFVFCDRLFRDPRGICVQRVMRVSRPMTDV